jgi:hypothetical protein
MTEIVDSSVSSKIDELMRSAPPEVKIVDAATLGDQSLPPQFTPQQIQHIKMSLIEKLQKQYVDFLNSIAHFPCYREGQLEAFKHFDTGFLWYKSAIENLVIAPIDPNAAQAPAPVAPQQPDAPEAA